ncbi:MAG: hypothetical protein ACFFD2_18850, partial [Promethearchaeota archaeon]
WKPARWVDYSGAIETGTIEGVTLFDNPVSGPLMRAMEHIPVDRFRVLESKSLYEERKQAHWFPLP